MLPDWSYRLLQAPWQRLGDTFIVVSTGQLIMFTNSADAVRQIALRREAFPKPLENYKILSIFGRNMLTTEGSVWRMHRKATAPSFNERNAAHIFAESIAQTQGMIVKWMGDSPDGKRSKTISTLEHDTMTLALNIIAHVGFGLRFLWPGQPIPEEWDAKDRKYASHEPPEGHTMKFGDALAMVLERILLLLLMPRWLLKVLPFAKTKEAFEANDNYVKYMDEFMQDKIEGVRRGDNSDGKMDLMGQLVRSKYGTAAGKEKKANGSAGEPQLSDSDILGNAFIIIVAGHETTANTLHFTLLELANNPAAQRDLQLDVDRLLGDSDPSTWNYENSINAMFASHLAACMNETLRMVPAVVDIPKWVSPGQDQTVAFDGEKHHLPKGTMIVWNTVAVQRNARYWPSKPSRLSGADHDLNDFVPERWYRESLASSNESTEVAEEEDFGGFKGPDTSAQLFRPVRGSFIPFSEGARSCLGRRIAQVEMIAALAVLFQRYSLELAVDEWATDEEVARMSKEERAELYKKAQDKSRGIIRQATSVLTLKLHGKLFVPVRLVVRGEERFLDIVDTVDV